jgi:hypothetical protein
MPLTGNPDTLQKMADLYLIVFWALTVAFVGSTVESGYDKHLALLAFTTAGTACVLLRLKRKADTKLDGVVADRAWQTTEIGRSVLAQSQLLLHMTTLIDSTRAEEPELSLTLVGVRTPGPGSPNSVVTNLVRGVLFRETDARVFETDADTFLIAERQPDAPALVEVLAAKLNSEMNVLRSKSAGLQDYRLTVGTTIRKDPACTAADLLANARASRDYAEAYEREKFVCVV